LLLDDLDREETGRALGQVDFETELVGRKTEYWRFLSRQHSGG